MEAAAAAETLPPSCNGDAKRTRDRFKNAEVLLALIAVRRRKERCPTVV